MGKGGGERESEKGRVRTKRERLNQLNSDGVNSRIYLIHISLTYERSPYNISRIAALGDVQQRLSVVASSLLLAFYNCFNITVMIAVVALS